MLMLHNTMWLCAIRFQMHRVTHKFFPPVPWTHQSRRVCDRRLQQVPYHAWPHSEIVLRKVFIV